MWHKGADSRAHYNILPHLSSSKWSPFSLRRRQVPGDLAEGSIFCHLVDHPSSPNAEDEDYFLGMKIKKFETNSK